ncbi:MAG: bifunctional phosphoribosylaminoimidazolecarboxamide formyltransferase/inosine monophosphate cyclohydrolase [Chitinophagaceae bacterium]
MTKKIQSALISVFYKDGLETIVKKLSELGISIYSTGGTQEFIEKIGVKVIPVENLTTYPSILGGRVKTLHPSVFGGILGKRDDETHVREMKQYNIPEIDLVIVDLYPFEETVAATSDEKAIIEKIDIGGPSMIRGAAKNFKDVVVIAAKKDYAALEQLLIDQKGETTIEQRKTFAAKAFEIVAHYDVTIAKYFNPSESLYFLESITNPKAMRYGENPHQSGVYYGELEKLFAQLNGKELSYNNLVDVEAAVQLISEWPTQTLPKGGLRNTPSQLIEDSTLAERSKISESSQVSPKGGDLEGAGDITFAIIKHTNVCGISQKATTKESWDAALAGDSESAFGGVLVTNGTVDKATAEAINEIFFEVLIAPGFDEEALVILKSKKNRILLQLKKLPQSKEQYKSVLNGVLIQDIDEGNYSEWKEEGGRETTISEKQDLEFANIVCKHLKSNAIALIKNKQLIGKGCGQTSRIDSLRQAIEKAKQFNFNLQGAVMASDAFFPFNDCVKSGHEAGISAFIQPGGSIRDKDSIEYCKQNNLAMVITGMRHFKH